MQETESAIRSASMTRANVWSIGLIVLSSIAFAHHEVQTAEHGGHVANQATGQKLRQDTKVHEGWGANLQPIRNAAASAVDVKAKFSFWIFGSEGDFTPRRMRSR